MCLRHRQGRRERHIFTQYTKTSLQHISSATVADHVPMQGSFHLPLGGNTDRLPWDPEILQCNEFGGHHETLSRSKVTTFKSSRWPIWRLQAHTLDMSHNQTRHWIYLPVDVNISYWLTTEEQNTEEWRQEGKRRVWMLKRSQISAVSKQKWTGDSPTGPFS